MSATSTKTTLRQALRAKRKQYSADYRAYASERIAFYARPFLKRGKRLAGYWATGSEVDLTPTLLHALSRQVHVFLPAIPTHGRRLWFSYIDGKNEWYTHPRYRIIECSGQRLRANKLDGVMVPLIGVDKQGFRLGQGGGFYDTTLAFKKLGRLSVRPIVIGIGFDCQRVELLPTDSWDIQLDYLITESGLTHFRHK